MSWIDLGELDPQTGDHVVRAHGDGSDALQAALDQGHTPEAEVEDLRWHLIAGIPLGTTILGVKEVEEMVGTASAEDREAMRQRLHELQAESQTPLGHLAIAS